MIKYELGKNETDLLVTNINLVSKAPLKLTTKLIQFESSVKPATNEK